MRYPGPGQRGTRIVSDSPSPVQDEPPGPPDAGVRVDLPAGAVEALVVRPGDLLVLRVNRGESGAFAEEFQAGRPAELAGRVMVIECEQLGVLRRLE